MIVGARKLPVSHISIRVPWHDSAWNGTVCQRPRENTSCLILPLIADARAKPGCDDRETACAGERLDQLKDADRPPCIAERAAFMAPFGYTRTVPHPYSESSPDTHGHFLPTLFQHHAHSAACIPFRWMLKQNVAGDKTDAGLAAQLKLDYQPDREPELKFRDNWIQERTNQLVVLDTFFSAIRPEDSLCFFYAKKTPLSDDSRRIIVGVGRVRGVGESVEYKRKSSDGLRCMLWERNIAHSIRDDFADGFILSYEKILELAARDGSIAPQELVAFAPEDHWDDFSYATEHVSHDAAISSLLACAGALKKIGEHVPGPWDRAQAWIDRELNRIWKMRGPYPGLGSALTALGIQHGNLIAYDLAAAQAQAGSEWNESPWPLFEQALAAPSLLSKGVGEDLGDGYREVWKRLTPERKALLTLLSRFSLRAEQATRYYQQTEREAAGIDVKDADLLANPYLLYELDRGQLDAIDLTTIDRGLFPAPVVRDKHPLPKPSALSDAVDPWRVRAFVLDALEQAAARGHTLQPRNWVIQAVRDAEMSPPVPLSVDILAVAEEHFGAIIHQVEMADGSPAYQLDRLVSTGALIKSEVEKRIRGKRHSAQYAWRQMLDEKLPKDPPKDPEREERARIEKAAALEELYGARIAVLAGPAGTGKTTLLSTLCGLPEVDSGGVLLLAPTGKACVKMSQATGREASTVAQFLLPLKRYDPDTGRYLMTGTSPRSSDYKTVIIDECSMLTEEQLAAVLDALSGVERLILVGDPRQLPPIGSGRPFVDIVRRVAPPNAYALFPRCRANYAELTVTCRTGGDHRDDVLLAQWFSGNPPDPGADEIWERLAIRGENLRLIEWQTPEELETKLFDELVPELVEEMIREEADRRKQDLDTQLATQILTELALDSASDEDKLERSLGGSEFHGAVYFRLGAAAAVERWQLLSPVHALLHGTDSLNRTIQARYRTRARRWAEPEKYWQRKTPKPMGYQKLLYGDKVMSLVNDSRKWVYPKTEASNYVANGDIGIIVGEFKGQRWQKDEYPNVLEVEYATKLERKYKYFESEFGDEATPPLELAYALTIHKAQGSEFGLTFVVLPNPCWLLSRELLYTALTRQRHKVVVLHQGSLHEFHHFSSDDYSEIARRLSNLFAPPNPVETSKGFFEEALIHKTQRGDLVRSKSEVIIANLLYALGVKDYQYERELRGPDGSRRYPDFTVADPATGLNVYLEHLGMLNHRPYEERWKAKLQWYAKAGIQRWEDGGGENGTLLVTEDGPDGSIDSAEIERRIRQVLGV